MAQRPDNFTLNMSHPLASGLVFAGLGALPGSTRYHDSSPFGNHGVLTNMDPATDWVWNSMGRRGISTDGAQGGNQHVVTTAKMPATGGLTLHATIANRGSLTFNDLLGFAIDSNNYLVLNEGSGASAIAVYAAIGGSQTVSFTGSISSISSLTITISDVTGGTLALYGNGTLLGSDASCGNIAALAGQVLCIGKSLREASREAKGDYFDVGMWRLVLSDKERSMLDDPSNVMLSGLILPPRRKWWPVVSGGTPAFKAAWAMRRRQTIGGGVM